MAATDSSRLRLGRAGFGVGDEAVAVRLESVMEIQCHGGSVAVRSVVAALEAAGALPCVRNGPGWASVSAGDPIAVQALLDLPHAPTIRTAEILLDQVNGALRAELVRHRDPSSTRPDRLLEALDVLIARGKVGRRLLSGWKVVISGRPNVGKSRLFNALAGFSRAIVNPTPGVTRDVVTYRTAFGGWPIELADTAGIRDTEDAIERIGIERTRREQGDADLSIIVLDRSEPLQTVDHELIEANPGALLVASKSDLPSAWDLHEACSKDSSIATVSAESGDGLEELISTIVRRLVPDSPAAGDAVPFRIDHLVALSQARDSLIAGDPAAAFRRLAAIAEDSPE